MLNEFIEHEDILARDILNSNRAKFLSLRHPILLYFHVMHYVITRAMSSGMYRASSAGFFVPAGNSWGKLEEGSEVLRDLTAENPSC